MHHSALKIGHCFFQAYTGALAEGTVVDLGSQDVNGTLKLVCPGNLRYIGVDSAAGPGVDIVLVDPYVLPFESESVDVIVCSSVLEHSEFFWLLFLEALRVLKPHGLMYINAPANGEFHRYPVDCWRFYPDAGGALVRWAQRNGVPALLLESFVGEQDGDQWNDFVAVVLKDRSNLPRYPQRILDMKADFTNGIRASSGEILLNYRIEPEDQFRLKGIRRIAGSVLPVSAGAEAACPHPSTLAVHVEHQELTSTPLEKSENSVIALENKS